MRENPIWWDIKVLHLDSMIPSMHISTHLWVNVSLSAWSTAGTVTEIASCQHQNIHKLRHNEQYTAWILKRRKQRRRWVGGGVLEYPFKPISDIFHGLDVCTAQAVLSGLCLRITACLLWSPAPTLKRCGPKMFYLLSRPASIKLMESIQLPSLPFPFRPGHWG